MKINTEQKVGLFFIVALIALAVMIELVEDWQPFEKQSKYHTYFTSAVGLKVGDPVRMAGVEVGKIIGNSSEADVSKSGIEVWRNDAYLELEGIFYRSAYIDG